MTLWRNTVLSPSVWSSPREPGLHNNEYGCTMILKNMSPLTGWHGMIFQMTWIFINTTVRKSILHVVWYFFTNLVNPIQDLKFLYTDLTWRLFLHLECLLYYTVYWTTTITNDLQVWWSYGFTLLLFTSVSLIQFTETCFVSICLGNTRFCFSWRRLWRYKFVPTWTFVVFLQ